MKVWVISTKESFAQYSIDRFTQEAPGLGVGLEVFRPGELEFSVADERPWVAFQGRRLEPPDVLLVRTGASTITYHTLALMQFLELHTATQVINPFGTYTRSRDKVLTSIHLAARGIPVPRTQLLGPNYSAAALGEKFGFPLVVKEISGARGNSVLFCNSATELEELLQFISTVRKPGTEFLVQEYVPTSVGRDVRAYVLGDQILGAIERKARGGARKANVSLGGEVRQVEVTAGMAEVVHDVRRAVGLAVGGVDLLYCESGYKVCEVNLSAQFVGFEKATGVNVARSILEYCRSRCGVGVAAPA